MIQGARPHQKSLSQPKQKCKEQNSHSRTDALEYRGCRQQPAVHKQNGVKVSPDKHMHMASTKQNPHSSQSAIDALGPTAPPHHTHTNTNEHDKQALQQALSARISSNQPDSQRNVMTISSEAHFCRREVVQVGGQASECIVWHAFYSQEAWPDRCDTTASYLSAEESHTHTHTHTHTGTAELSLTSFGVSKGMQCAEETYEQKFPVPCPDLNKSMEESVFKLAYPLDTHTSSRPKQKSQKRTSLTLEQMPQSTGDVVSSM